LTGIRAGFDDTAIGTGFAASGRRNGV